MLNIFLQNKLIVAVLSCQLLIFTTITLKAQTVSGTVRSATDNQPLPGVTIHVSNSSKGTVTDNQGHYLLEGISPNDTLVFSFVGYRAVNQKVGKKKYINISLVATSASLDQLVVIGYGTEKSQNVTNAISRMSSKGLQERSVPDLTQALKGKLAGVLIKSSSGGRPGSGLSFNIRGIGSINASNAPLYIVDGIPVPDIQNISPDDIASIEVLKDAAAVAIYGSRGAGGAVLITTKAGSPGKVSFDFSMYQGFQKAAKTLHMMNKDQYLAWNIWGRNVGWLRQGGSLSDPMSIRSVQIPEKWFYPDSLPNINWQREILQTAPIENFHLSASGGGRIGNFYASGSYMKQKGIVKETGYQRINFRLNTNVNVGKRFQLGLSLAPSFSISNNPQAETRGVLLYAATTPPIAPLESQTQEWGYIAGTLGYPNPLESLKETHQENRENRIFTSISGKLEIIKPLTIKSQFGYFQDGYHVSYFKTSNVNQGNPAYNTSVAANFYKWSLQNTINYTPKISKLIDFKLLLGQSLEGAKKYFLNTYSIGFPNPLVYTMNVASTPTLASSRESKSYLTSFFGRATFNVKNRYLASASIRRDGSSRFGINSKWGWFPAFSLGWKINEEDFMKPTENWLDLLKLRISIGKTGNNRIGYYESIGLLGVSNYNINGEIVNGLVPTSISNPNLGWEVKKSLDIGLDIDIFRSRIQASIDYYIAETQDMLLSVPVSYMTGFSSVRKNLGRVSNKGWEVQITSHNLINRFKWTTSLNFSRNVNEVKQLGPHNTPLIHYYAGYPVNITKVGSPINSYYMYKTNGFLLNDDFDSNGNPLVPIAPGQEEGNYQAVDINKDGKITPADITVVGKNQPDFIWGLNNRFSYKGVSLQIFIQGVQGGKVFFSEGRHLDLGQTVNGFNQFPRWLHSWKKEFPKGIDNPYPKNDELKKIDMKAWDGKTPSRFGNNLPFNDRWLYNGSYIRINNISLGYTLTGEFINHIGIESAKIYVSGDNIKTWTNYPGPTPETNTNGYGSDYGTYPLAKTYSIGISITF